MAYTIAALVAVFTSRILGASEQWQVNAGMIAWLVMLQIELSQLKRVRYGSFGNTSKKEDAA